MHEAEVGTNHPPGCKTRFPKQKMQLYKIKERKGFWIQSGVNVSRRSDFDSSQQIKAAEARHFCELSLGFPTCLTHQSSSFRVETFFSLLLQEFKISRYLFLPPMNPRLLVVAMFTTHCEPKYGLCVLEYDAKTLSFTQDDRILPNLLGLNS